MGFIVVPELTVLDIVGRDAPRVLNNVCTAPVLQLIAGDGCEAFITEVRGRTLGHVCVYRDSDRLRLIGAAGQSEVVAAHLDRYTIREDAVTEDHSREWTGLLTDEEILRPIAPAFALAAPVTPQSLPWRALQADAPAMHDSPFQDLALYRIPWTGDGRVLTVGPRAAIDALAERLRQVGADALDESVFHAARVINRFPWFGIDLDDRNLPQEADRDAQAISFTKGCYLGQETVARLDALGQVQKKLVLWRIDSPQPPAAGTQLSSEGRAVGRLTSVVANPSGDGFLALGFARRSHFDPGARAQWKTEDDRQMDAVVV